MPASNVWYGHYKCTKGEALLLIQNSGAPYGWIQSTMQQHMPPAPINNQQSQTITTSKCTAINSYCTRVRYCTEVCFPSYRMHACVHTAQAACCHIIGQIAYPTTPADLSASQHPSLFYKPVLDHTSLGSSTAAGSLCRGSCCLGDLRRLLQNSAS